MSGAYQHKCAKSIGAKWLPDVKIIHFSGINYLLSGIIINLARKRDSLSFINVKMGHYIAMTYILSVILKEPCHGVLSVLERVVAIPSILHW